MYSGRRSRLTRILKAPRDERKIRMMNKRSSRLLAWLLTMIMVFNLAPTSVFAEDDGNRNVSINDYRTTLKTSYDLDEEADVSSKKTEDIMSLTFSDEGKDPFPSDGSVKMYYTLDDDVFPIQPSGSNDEVSWEYDQENHQLIFTWNAQKASSFAVEMPIVPQPDDAHYVVHHVKRLLDGTTETEYERKEYINKDSKQYSYSTREYEGFRAEKVYKDQGGNNPANGIITLYYDQLRNYTVKYAIKGDYNYIDGTDIVFFEEEKLGDPQKDTINVPDRFADNEEDKVISNKASTDSSWDEGSSTLTLYYPPVENKITLHYRKIKADGSSQNLDQTNGNREYGYEGESVNPTISKYNDKTIIRALGFTIPETWIDIDEHFTYDGYTFKTEDPANRNHSKTINWDYKTFYRLGDGGNSNIYLYYLSDATTESGDTNTAGIGNTDGSGNSGDSQGVAGQTVTTTTNNQPSNTFTVKYVIKGTDTEIADPETIEYNGNGHAYANYKNINGFNPTQYSLDLTRDQITNDTVKFEYTPKEAQLYIQYYHNGQYNRQDYKAVHYGDVITYSDYTETGYTFDHANPEGTSVTIDSDSRTIQLYYVSSTPTATPVPTTPDTNGHFTVETIVLKADGTNKSTTTQTVNYADLPSGKIWIENGITKCQYDAAEMNGYTPDNSYVQWTKTSDTEDKITFIYSPVEITIQVKYFLDNQEKASYEEKHRFDEAITLRSDYDFIKNANLVAIKRGNGNLYESQTYAQVVDYDRYFGVYYEKQIEYFKVTFVDEDNSVLKAAKEYAEGTAGTAIERPDNPSKTGYSFNGWDTIPEKVTADTTIKATYKVNQYDVTFVDEEGNELNTTKYNYGTEGKDITAPEAPAKTGYTFKAWDTIPVTVTENVTIKPTYTINQYDVTFVDEDGTVLLAAAKYNYNTAGEEIAKPESEPASAAGIPSRQL